MKNMVKIAKIKKPKIVIFDWNGTLVAGGRNNFIKPLPNAKRTLDILKSGGINISLISNTYTPFLNKMVKRYRFEKYFLNIIGSKGEVAYKKPDKEVVDHAIIGANVKDVNSDTVWMVGDSIQDMQTAYNANLRPIIFGEELLNIMLRKEGVEKNKNAIYCKDHMDLINIIKDFEHDSSKILAK